MRPKGSRSPRRPPEVHPSDWVLKFCWLSPDGCWVYMRGLDRCGYAQIIVDGRMSMAHRVVYEHEVGPIPEGMEIDHLCRVRNCLNPQHMEVVTRRQNVRRGTSGEATRTMWRSKETCARGHSDWAWSKNGSRPDFRYCRTCKWLAVQARKQRKVLAALQ